MNVTAHTSARAHRADTFDQAVCAGMDPDEADDAFFPTTDTTYAKAKRICSRCPVSDLCLAATLKVEQGAGSTRFGFFGGKTPNERARLAGGRVSFTKEPEQGDTCNTLAGYRAHRRHREQACDTCRAVWNAYNRAVKTRAKQTAAAGGV